MRAAGVLLPACLLLAGVATAQPAEPPAAQPGAGGDVVRIYGVELEASGPRERVLVFGDGLLRPRLEELDPGTVMLSFPGSRLDPSAPTQLATKPGGVVSSVTVFETAEEPREVRVTVLRSANVSPTLSQRGGQVAIDFQRPGPAGRRSGRAARAQAAQASKAAQAAPAERTLEARWLAVDAATVVERLARFVERRVIIDKGVLTGSVSIEAPDPITPAEAAELFDALLLLKGLAAVAGPGGALKIVPLAAAPGPWVESLEAQPEGAALITLLRLEHMSAELAVQAIAPLVGQHGLVLAYPPSNAVLMAGVQSRLARLSRILRELDSAGATRLVLIPLEHADAVQTADALLAAFEAESTFDVWPDARTSRLIVRARRQTLERVRDFVARVDRRSEGQGNIQVIPVNYSDVEQIANVLRQLAQQTGQEDPGVLGAESLAGRDFAVSVHGPTHSLVVQADPSTISVIRELVAEIDRLPQRVLVEASVSEVSFSDNLALGFDAIVPLIEPDDPRDLVAAALLNPSSGFTPQDEAGAVDPVLRVPTSGSLLGRIARAPILIPITDPTSGQTLVLPIPRETFILTANASEVTSRVLMQPRLVLISGEEHEIFAGTNVPVPTASEGEVTNPLRTSQSVERQDVGVTLRVKPTVPEQGPIALDVLIEVSAVSGNSEAGPTFVERTVDALLYLESGRSAVIAGAVRPNRGSVRIGVPVLMDIPILGWLFRSTQERVMNVHTLVTLSVVRQHDEAPELTRWMLERLDEETSDVAARREP